MGNKVTHFEMAGGDGKKLQEFYSGLFGWNIDANNPMSYGMSQPDAAFVGLVKAGSMGQSS